MEVLHPELQKALRDMDLAQEAEGLLLATLAGEVKSIAPGEALGLLRLVGRLKSNEFSGLVPPQKTQLLGNLISLIRRGKMEWVSKVCYSLYEGNPGPRQAHSVLPRGMIRDLLRWVNGEKAEKVRESLWAILLRKGAGLAGVARIADVAAGLLEKDPIIRNNAIRFFSEHFPPEEVVDFLIEFSMVSGKRVPGAVFQRYAGLLKEQKDFQHKKDMLEKILRMAKLDDKEMDQVFSEYMSSMNRFDLIRLLSDLSGPMPQLMELKRKGKQMGFPFDYRKSTRRSDGGFRQRIFLLMTKTV